MMSSVCDLNLHVIRDVDVVTLSCESFRSLGVDTEIARFVSTRYEATALHDALELNCIELN
jgi:hypothetical protein